MTKKMGEAIVADLKLRSANGLALAKQLLQSEHMEYPKLREAFEHYIAHWNDFTHIGLFSMACEAVGGDPEGVPMAQAGLAMITAAFDVQDDIIDRSKEKHKVPTVFGKFGAEVAILLGNAFLIKGFKIFADSVGNLSRKKGICAFETTKELLFEMGNAHALEIGFKKRKSVSPQDYLKITELKAAGLEADMYLGALFGGGEESEIAVLRKIGRLLGILATLRDDLVDVFDIEELSQRISVSDLPLPVLFAMQEKECKKQIASIIAKKALSDEDVSELVDITLIAPPVVELKHKMELLIGEGLNLTKSIRNRRMKQSLQALFSFMLEDL